MAAGTSGRRSLWLSSSHTVQDSDIIGSPRTYVLYRPIVRLTPLALNILWSTLISLEHLNRFKSTMDYVLYGYTRPGYHIQLEVYQRSPVV